MFALEFSDEKTRSSFQKSLAANNVVATTHYEPLHNSIAGMRYGYTVGNMDHTLSISSKILRLPIWTKKMDDVFDDYSEALNRV